MKPVRYPDTLIAALLGLFAFVIYALTCAPHVGTEDPGEIATALHGLGILHPTGYPIYTMLGSLFARLPVADTVIERLNLFGAVLTALATFLFYGTFRLLLTGAETPLFRRHGAERDAIPDSVTRFGAATATIVFAFSAVYWSEAVWVEVYALHLVFLALVIRLFVNALKHPESDRRWLLFAYVLGLSFAHHMMTVLLAPAFLVLFFQVNGLGRRAWMRIAQAVPSFVLALTAYLYLPIRSAANPLMNWGEPSTIAALWKHVRAAQYGDQMFSSGEIALRKLIQFATDLPGAFGYAPLALALFGLWTLRRSPRLLLFSLLLFLTGLFYAINYAFDDPNFNLNSHFTVAFWGGCGAIGLLGYTRRSLRVPVGILLAAVAACPLVFNYRALDKSQDTLVVDYARNMLESMDSGGVIFTNEYERFGSPAFYLQNVEGFRRDVTVLDIILLGNPWYFSHIAQRDPWLMKAVQPELDRFRSDMDRFLKDQNDSAGIRENLDTLFHAIVARCTVAGRPVYVTSSINPALIERYQHAPTGMVFRLLSPEDTIRVPLREPHFQTLAPWNGLLPVIRSDYALSFAYLGLYQAQGGDSAEARRLLRRALDLRPDFPEAEQYLKELEQPRP